MIVFPGGQVALAIELTVSKRIVDSVSGNPRTLVTLEYFDSMADQINSNTGYTTEDIEISKMADFTMKPANFSQIEEWLVGFHPNFIQCKKVQ